MQYSTLADARKELLATGKTNGTVYKVLVSGQTYYTPQQPKGKYDMLTLVLPHEQDK